MKGFWCILVAMATLNIVLAQELSLKASYLEDYVCKALDSDLDLLVDKEEEMCSGSCSLGPFNVEDAEGENVDVFFCENNNKKKMKDDVRSTFCKMSRGDKVITETECVNGECTIGPLGGPKDTEFILCDGDVPGEGMKGQRKKNKKGDRKGKKENKGGKADKMEKKAKRKEIRLKMKALKAELFSNPLERIACAIDGNSTKTCEAGSECTRGPIEIRLRHRYAAHLTFCSETPKDTQLRLADLACRVRAVEDDSPILVRPCPCNQVCNSISPLADTAHINGTDVAVNLDFCQEKTFKEMRKQAKADKMNNKNKNEDGADAEDEQEDGEGKKRNKKGQKGKKDGNKDKKKDGKKGRNGRKNKNKDGVEDYPVAPAGDIQS